MNALETTTWGYVDLELFQEFNPRFDTFKMLTQ